MSWRERERELPRYLGGVILAYITHIMKCTMEDINQESAIDNTNGIIQLIIYHYWMKIVLDQFESF